MLYTTINKTISTLHLKMAWGNADKIEREQWLNSECKEKEIDDCSDSWEIRKKKQGDWTKDGLSLSFSKRLKYFLYPEYSIRINYLIRHKLFTLWFIFLLYYPKFRWLKYSSNCGYCYWCDSWGWNNSRCGIFCNHEKQEENKWK